MIRLAFTLALALVASAAFPSRADLARDLGRNDVRVYGAPYAPPQGRTVEASDLPARLERLGYERVHERPSRPGTWFWGEDVVWVFAREHRRDGRSLDAALVGWRLDARGRFAGAVRGDGAAASSRADAPRLEPELLATSLDGGRFAGRPVALDDLPEHAWRALLAAEDARFFEHVGLDGRGIARAALANIRAAGVEQGGSTITQQLVKLRDLSPRRTVGRKASEALRALALEAEYDKREILAAYLNEVYYGHVDGIAVHGIAAAAEVYFSKSVSRLELAESAVLAALVQAPNRLNPLRHAERVRARRDWVLDRLGELGWVEPAALAAARERPVRTRPAPPPVSAGAAFVRWIGDLAGEAAPTRRQRGRGVVVESSLDPSLQRHAELVIAEWLARVRADYPRLRDAPLSAALVALDAGNGSVLAHVGGDPRRRDDRFDRGRLARRQPGSAVKPLLLLEAFDDCGDRAPLAPASRVADEPLRVDLPSGSWEPRNADRSFAGVMSVRDALVASRNVPFVRIATWCGLAPTARRLRAAGLAIPDDPPPALALGAVETTPLELATAYTAVAAPGRIVHPRPARRVEKPSGRRLATPRINRDRVTDPAAAWLVRDAMRSAVERGTAAVGAIPGVDVAAKTGTSSDRRDAWFVGDADGIVTVVWVGSDDDRPLGAGGAALAGPPWRRFMERAILTVPPRPVERPGDVVDATIDPRSGLRVRDGRRGAVTERFRRRDLPRRDRPWRADRETPVVR